MRALPNTSRIVFRICLLSGVKCNSIFSSAASDNATNVMTVTEDCDCYALCCELRLGFVLWPQRHSHLSLCLCGNCHVTQYNNKFERSMLTIRCHCSGEEERKVANFSR